MATQPTHKKLSSGIQSFAEASPDYEMAPIGIASMQEQAKKLAEYGRNGDIYIVHAAEGETVIPMEVLNANPKIKNLLFNQMTEMGLDPQEFIVGNELNSINPDTGLPEFFLSRVYRKVKKAAKKAFGAVKKIAPIAIPIALSMFGGPAFMGPAFGAGSFGAAALGGGLGTLAGGGSLKDAFKSAVISGGTSALLGGAKSMMGGKTFGQGVMNTLYPVNAPSAGLQFDRLTSGDSQQLLDFIGTSPKGESFNPMGIGSPDPIEVSETVNFPPKSNVSAARLAKTSVGPFGSPGSKYVPLTSSYQSSAPVTNLLGEQKLVDQAAKIAMETAKKDAPFYSMFTGGPTIDSGALVAADERLLNLSNAGTKYANKILAPGAGVNPGMLRTYGPLAAAGGIAAYAGGAFDPVPVEEVSEQDLTGYVNSDYVKGGNNPLYEANPGEYKVADINPYRYAPSSYPRVPSGRLAGGLRVLGGPQPFMANKGGYMNKQPRNNELPQFAGYVRGPGTTTSDSIPGYLSDKEFVFNAESVAGADPSGRGDYNAGASNLYNLMRNLQMRA